MASSIIIQTIASLVQSQSRPDVEKAVELLLAPGCQAQDEVRELRMDLQRWFKLGE